MNEKQSNHIDKRVRDAAENARVPYDEQSWERMEALLEDDERKPLFIWIFSLAAIILVAGISAYVLFNIKSDAVIAKVEIKAEQKVSTTPVNNLENLNKQKNIQENSKYNAVPVIINPDKKIGLVAPAKNSTLFPTKQSIIGENAYAKENLKKNKMRFKQAYQSKGNATIHVSDNAVQNENQSLVNSSAELVTNNVQPSKDERLVSATPGIKSEDKKVNEEDSLSNRAVDNGKSNSKPKKQKGFYMLAGVGLEATSVNFLSMKNSTVVPRYGLGVGYSFNKKLSIQTGFYISRKKYIAGPDDYKTTGSYWSNVTIIKADANCLVYDIPLTLKYNIIQKNKNAFFATAGIHSFIMKKETYDYHFLYGSTYYNRAYSYTGNKGWFGVLSFSGGIERKISEKCAFIGEPSFTIPLKGVGDGRVKLFSMGLQASLKYSFR